MESPTPEAHMFPCGSFVAHERNYATRRLAAGRRVNKARASPQIPPTFRPVPSFLQFVLSVRVWVFSGFPAFLRLYCAVRRAFISSPALSRWSDVSSALLFLVDTFCLQPFAFRSFFQLCTLGIFCPLLFYSLIIVLSLCIYPNDLNYFPFQCSNNFLFLFNICRFFK